MPRRLLRLAPATCIAALVALATAAPPAAAAAPSPVFALEPVANAPYYVFDTRAGTTISGLVRVVNAGSASGSARIYAVDATTGPTSGASYLTDARRQSDVGAWTRLDVGRVSLAPHQATTVRFTVRVPRGARAGDHLGGIVADPGARRGGVVTRARSTFRINVRTLTVVAVEVRVSGKRVPGMAIDSIAAGGMRGYQQLLVGLRNAGNVLMKGNGSVLVESRAGTRLKFERFTLDTFVPSTAIAYPVFVHGRPLPVGSYRALVTVRYAGRTISRWFGFDVTAHDLAQVFGSPPGSRPGRTKSLPLWLLIVGGLLLALAGFAVATLRARNRQMQLALELRERELRELELWSPSRSGTVRTDGSRQDDIDP